MPKNPEGKGYWSTKLKDPDFQRLQAEWQAKLAQSGFQDIEDPQGNLKVATTPVAKRSKRALALTQDLNTALGLGLKLNTPYRALAKALIDGVHYTTIAQQLGVSVRTFYRLKGELVSLTRQHLRSALAKVNTCEGVIEDEAHTSIEVLEIFAAEQQKVNNDG